MATAASPSSRARASPGASATLLTTRAIPAGRSPRATAAWRARKLLPRPESRMPRRASGGGAIFVAVLLPPAPQLVDHPLAPLADLADHGTAVAGGAQGGEHLRQPLGRDDRHHADPEVEDAQHFFD